VPLTVATPVEVSLLTPVVGASGPVVAALVPVVPVPGVVVPVLVVASVAVSPGSRGRSEQPVT
jgi:hypothetical protein